MKKMKTRTFTGVTRQKKDVISSINAIRNKVRTKRKKWDSVKLLRRIRNDP